MRLKNFHTMPSLKIFVLFGVVFVPAIIQGKPHCCSVLKHQGINILFRQHCVRYDANIQYIILKRDISALYFGHVLMFCYLNLIKIIYKCFNLNCAVKSSIYTMKVYHVYTNCNIVNYFMRLRNKWVKYV